MRDAKPDLTAFMLKHWKVPFVGTRIDEETKHEETISFVLREHDLCCLDITIGVLEFIVVSSYACMFMYMI
jgi:hypothetical protein